uniref:G-protein coupled receptors family 1 profile domain-containing protein n=1 Tax=Salarias fasciatus TaxID=181472 RepID=A0A672G339_SALFA
MICLSEIGQTPDRKGEHVCLSIDEQMHSTPYPLGFQVSLTTVLMLELVLGFSSNLTVLVLYCAQSNLVDSVSNLVTVNLHVLDILVCVLCLPLTVAVILLPASESGVSSLATLCCFHEACVTFTSVATAVNVLVISLDRYDISVRPASRLLTPRRALTTGLTPIFSSLAPSLLPSAHPSSPSHHLPPAWQNRTLLCVGGQGYYTGLAMYYHLLLQVPCFFIAVAVMLFTYSRILQALNIRIGSHMMRNTRATTPLPASSMGVQASVSAIIALRRAVRRHRDRRERQRRVLKMSLIIISTFLGCWAPLSAVNVLILCMGPSDGLVRLRLCFLAMAYGTTIFHPLLYAFTRQKLRRALKTRVKKRVVSLLQVDPAPSGGTVIHNSWVEGGGQRKNRKPRVEASDGTDRCLTEAVRE